MCSTLSTLSFLFFSSEWQLYSHILFSYFSVKTYGVTLHYNCLGGMVLVRLHNILLSSDVGGGGL